MHVIAIASQKGGVGKTTISLNLGLALARAGNRTLILELKNRGPRRKLMASLPPLSSSGSPSAATSLPSKKYGILRVATGSPNGPTGAPGKSTKRSAVPRRVTRCSSLSMRSWSNGADQSSRAATASFSSAAVLPSLPVT